MFTNDLAISTVSYDTLRVEQMMTLTALRLRSTPAWADTSRPRDGLPGAVLHEDASPVVLVLWRLWGIDEITAAEGAVLVVDFVLGAIADAGGIVLTKPAPTLAISTPRKRDCDDRVWKLHQPPPRVVARLDDVGTSFS